MKLGLAYEQSTSKAKSMGKNDGEDSRIHRLEEEVARLQSEKKNSSFQKKKDTQNQKCQTCPDGKRHEVKECYGKKSKDCKEAGHFKGAQMCKGKKKKKAEKTVRKMEESENSETETSSDSESLGRVIEKAPETVAAAKESDIKEPRVEVIIRPRKGAKERQVRWLADSGVRRTLLAESEWESLKKANPDTLWHKDESTSKGKGKGGQDQSERE